MVKRLKHIISLLLLIALLWPSIAILEHHHNHHDCQTHSKIEYQLNNEHEECLMCQFQFSLFSFYQAEQHGIFTETLLGLVESSYQCCFSDTSKFSFLLRGPPRFTISTI